MPEAPGVEDNGLVEHVPSPVEVMQTALSGLGVYSEAMDRLDGVNLDLQFGVLDDMLPKVEHEIDKRTRYSQVLAEKYFGPDAEKAIADMKFWDVVKIARRMKREDNMVALLGEARDVSGVVSKAYQKARRKTIGRLGRHSEELDGVETTAIVASRVAEFDEPQTSGRYAQPESPQDVLKAVKVLNGVTREVYPGDTDFEIMHELLGVSGTLVLCQAAPYLNLPARIQLVEGLFKRSCDPSYIKDIFEKGKNWHIYMQSLRAPKTLVGMLKEHQTAYNDIAAAKERAAALTVRITGLHGLLREVASHGVARHMEKAVGALGDLVQDETAASSVSGEVVQYLFDRLRYVDDEDTMIDLGQRLERLLVAA